MKLCNIILFNIFVLLFLNANAQDSLILKGGDFQHADSLIVIGNDSIKFIHGTNKTLLLHFYSKDLFYQIEYSKTYSKRPISNLYRFSGEGYLGDLPDTTEWKSFDDANFGIFIKYLPEFEVMINSDSINGFEFIEFGFYRTDTTADKIFIPWIRISYTSKNFFQEVSSHGWSKDYKGEWYSINNDISDVAYIEGENWKCLQGLETVVFYDENNYKGYGDKLKFLAMIERERKPSLLFELLIDYDNDRIVLEEELYTMLSSIRLYK